MLCQEVCMPGLGACTALTRLNLSDNRLTRMDGLAGLHRLRCA